MPEDAPVTSAVLFFRDVLTIEKISCGEGRLIGYITIITIII